MVGFGNLISIKEINQAKSDPFAIHSWYYNHQSVLDAMHPWLRSLQQNMFENIIGKFKSGASKLASGAKLTNMPLLYYPENLLSLNAILTKTDIKSTLGNYSYVVKQQNLDKQGELDAAFSTFVLSKMLNIKPDIFLDLENNEIKYCNYDDIIKKQLYIIEKIKQNQIIAKPVYTTSHDAFAYGNQQAIKTLDLTLLHGVGIEKRKKLTNCGIDSMKTLSCQSGGELIEKTKNVIRFNKLTAENMIQQARSFILDKPVRLKPVNLTSANPAFVSAIILSPNVLNVKQQSSNIIIGILDDKYTNYTSIEPINNLPSLNHGKVWCWTNHEARIIKKLFNYTGEISDIRSLVRESYAMPVPSDLTMMGEKAGFDWKYRLEDLVAIKTCRQNNHDPVPIISTMVIAQAHSRDKCSALKQIIHYLTLLN